MILCKRKYSFYFSSENWTNVSIPSKKAKNLAVMVQWEHEKERTEDPYKSAHGY